MNAKQQAAAVTIELTMLGAEMACGAKMYTGEDIRRLKRIATGFEGALSNLGIELAAMGVEIADNPHAHTPEDFRNLKLVYKAEPKPTETDESDPEVPVTSDAPAAQQASAPEPSKPVADAADAPALAVAESL